MATILHREAQDLGRGSLTEEQLLACDTYAQGMLRAEVARFGRFDDERPQPHYTQGRYVCADPDIDD